jgi:hypothetical protein
VQTALVLMELAVVVLDVAALAVSMLASAPAPSVFGALASRTLGGLPHQCGGSSSRQVADFAWLWRCVILWAVRRPCLLKLMALIAALAHVALPSSQRPNRSRPDGRVQIPQHFDQFCPPEVARLTVAVLSAPLGPIAVFERDEHFG